VTERRFRRGDDQEMRAYFEDRYANILSPVMLAIEAEVIGTDFGAVSWSSKAQVEEMVRRLELRPGDRYLDIGSGSGWPAIFIGSSTGAWVAMSDLPIGGLELGLDRANEDGVPSVAVQTSGASLPFSSRVFSGITHSDVLCCLSEKAQVLEECRRVIADHGVMVFTVIALSESAIPETLGELKSGPDFVESEAPYPTMLGKAGFDIEIIDLNREFYEAAVNVLAAREAHFDGLVELLGADEAEEVMDRSRDNLRDIEKGVLERHMYVCRPM
jgi:SAM-dependent methyltransferase